MPKPLGDIFLEFSSYVAAKNHDLLSYLLRLAAAEAYSVTREEEGFEISYNRRINARELIVGVWDWDVGNDLNYLDPKCAELFNTNPEDAARGLPNARYVDAIHPDDIATTAAALDRAIRNGGTFESEYRVIKDDRVRWVYARGMVVLDGSRRPIRFPGAIVDITHEKIAGHVIGRNPLYH
jgi:PAS domain-containing protein